MGAGIGWLRMGATSHVVLMKITKHPLMLDERASAAMPVDVGVVRKLEASFEVLKEPARAEAFTRGFYDRLFAAHPGLRSMFKTDMTVQRGKLFDSLKQVIAHLKDPAAQADHLAGLGQRHAGYGAKPEHYPIVCGLMVEAMAEACGAAWNTDLATEWRQALTLVSEAMLRGPEMSRAANQASPPAA